MGRRIWWKPQELGDRAHPWVYATEDYILGIDQTPRQFMSTIFAYFKGLAKLKATPSAYAGESQNLGSKKYTHLPQNVRCFEILSDIRNCKPIDVTEPHIISIIVHRHLWKISGMSYPAKDFPHIHRLWYLAYKYLEKHLKVAPLHALSSSQNLLKES